MNPLFGYGNTGAKKFSVMMLALTLPMMPEGVAASDQAPSRGAKKERLVALAMSASDELRNNILPFWLRYAPDDNEGGFHGAVGVDLKPVANAPRGSLLTSRILWSFSAAYRKYGDEACLAMARRAYDDLWTRFWDPEHGGLYWTTDAKGKPLDATKQIYAQAFGLYALSEFHRATGEPEARERAIQLFELIEKHGRDPSGGGYWEVFSREWKRARASQSHVNRVSTKSQNTHLHVMEAYTTLLRVWPDDRLRDAQRALLDIMLGRIWNPDTGHLHLYLDDAWKPQSQNFSYGHDIEAAWLMTEAASVLGDAALDQRARAAATQVANVTLAEGRDRDGGIVYEGNPKGVTDTHREWWPQAEAVVGFLDAYQISGDMRFLETAEASWAFIQKHLVDRDGGEWHHSTQPDGSVSRQPKISLWKCPYHNTRACLEIIERVERIQKLDTPR